MKAATKVGVKKWVLHADHISVKDPSPETIQGTKDLIKAQIDAGFTSFAIDASHIFNFDGKDEKEELAGNIKATVELGLFIKEEMAKKKIKSYGLEVEVGEVGRKDEKRPDPDHPRNRRRYSYASLNAAGLKPNLPCHGEWNHPRQRLRRQRPEDTESRDRHTKDKSYRCSPAQHGLRCNGLPSTG